MNNITSNIVQDYTLTGEFDIAASIKSDIDSVTSKSVTLRFVMTNTPLSEVINAALQKARVTWQNGSNGRAKFDQHKNGAVIKVNFSSPGRKQVDPEAAMIAKLMSMSPEDRAAYLKELQQKANKIN